MAMLEQTTSASLLYIDQFVFPCYFVFQTYFYVTFWRIEN